VLQSHNNNLIHPLIVPSLLSLSLSIQDPTLFTTPSWPHALHILSHIAASQLEDARFTYKRISPDTQQHPTIQATHSLLQLMWNKDYPLVWKTLQLLASLSPDLHVVIDAIKTRYQQYILDLIERAYSDISIEKLATLLGLDGTSGGSQIQVVVEIVAGRQGWKVGDDGFIDISDKVKNRKDMGTSTESVRKLASYIVALES
jgi:hypothetical protein